MKIIVVQDNVKIDELNHVHSITTKGMTRHEDDVFYPTLAIESRREFKAIEVDIVKGMGVIIVPDD